MIRSLINIALVLTIVTFGLTACNNGGPEATHSRADAALEAGDTVNCPDYTRDPKATTVIEGTVLRWNSPQGMLQFRGLDPIRFQGMAGGTAPQPGDRIRIHFHIDLATGSRILDMAEHCTPMFENLEDMFS
jgi:hypothetical protein